MVERHEQTYMDKSKWPDGVWKKEPDRVSWVDSKTGYHCLVRRNNEHSGILCGYVSVEKGHPLYGKDYCEPWKGKKSKYVREILKVHGGITYSEHCTGGSVRHAAVRDKVEN